jgi:hypothetical protein
VRELYCCVATAASVRVRNELVHGRVFNSRSAGRILIKFGIDIALSATPKRGLSHGLQSVIQTLLSHQLVRLELH